MGKKNKPQKTLKAAPAEPPDEPISALGWRFVGAGGLAVLLGFLVLSRVDRMGRNWAADVAPLLILGGYAAIGLGLFVPAKPQEGESPSSSPPSRP